jgi:hypothetical protein
MNRSKTLLMSLFAAAVLGLGATAQAQETPPPSDAPPPPPPAQHHSSSGGGAGIGVGAGVTLTGGTFGQFVYDQDIWHLEGLLTFGSFSTGGGGDRATAVGFGAGGWYHLHRGSSADFSVGGALTVNTFSAGGGGSTTVTAVEPGAQIRAFITPNVALSARVGLALQFGDTMGGGTDVQLLGQAQGAFGITYFFR